MIENFLITLGTVFSVACFICVELCIWNSHQDLHHNFEQMAFHLGTTSIILLFVGLFIKEHK